MHISTAIHLAGTRTPTPTDRPSDSGSPHTHKSDPSEVSSTDTIQNGPCTHPPTHTYANMYAYASDPAGRLSI
jgi:hypothetical protein